jgi:predicted helicase
MHCFNEIYVYNLHGNIRKEERAPDGGTDENVFDIQQGVAILLCVKQRGDDRSARVYHSDLWGGREAKYRCLAETDVATTQWEELHPSPQFFLFVPQDTSLLPEYEVGWKATAIFSVSSSGLNTLHDGLVISFDRESLISMLRDALDKEMADEQFREKYDVTDSRDWKLADCRARIANNRIDYFAEKIVQCLYRPFDKRWIVLEDAFVTYARWETTRHFLSTKSLGFAMNRQTSRTISILASRLPFGQHKIVDPYDRSYIFPLYLYPFDKEVQGQLHPEMECPPNFSPGFLKALAEELKLQQTQPHGLPTGITPEDIFHYAYAVFHSPTYRTRYVEFLKSDFPRLPLTSDLKLFRALAAKGAELVALHLMESPKLDQLVTGFPVKGDNVVEKVRYTDRDKRVWINKAQYFGGVPKNVWEFHIGGYQVCEKWLKDRKGRSLSYDDIQHYQKIVLALSETMRLMKEIDQAIPSWPIT